MHNLPALPGRVRFKTIYDVLKNKLKTHSPRLTDSDLEHCQMDIEYLSAMQMRVRFYPNQQQRTRYRQPHVDINFTVNLSLNHLINLILIKNNQYHDSQYQDIINWLPEGLTGTYNEANHTVTIRKTNNVRITRITPITTENIIYLYPDESVTVQLSIEKVDLVAIVRGGRPAGSIPEMISLSELDYIEPV